MKYAIVHDEIGAIYAIGDTREAVLADYRQEVGADIETPEEATYANRDHAVVIAECSDDVATAVAAYGGAPGDVEWEWDGLCVVMGTHA